MACKYKFSKTLILLCSLTLLPKTVSAAIIPPAAAGVFPGIGLKSSLPASYAFAESEFNFTASIVGPNIGDISGIGLETATNVFTGNFWQISVSVTADDGLVDDNISINWTATHISTPTHQGEGVGGAYNSILQSDGSEGSTIKRTPNNPNLFTTRNHASHEDFYAATLSTTVVSSLNFDEIVTWNWSIEGEHLPSNVAAVPLPAAAWLFGSGIIVLTGVARRKTYKTLHSDNSKRHLFC